MTFALLQGMHTIELSLVYLVAESQYNINIQGDIKHFWLTFSQYFPVALLHGLMGDYACPAES